MVVLVGVGVEREHTTALPRNGCYEWECVWVEGGGRMGYPRLLASGWCHCDGMRGTCVSERHCDGVTDACVYGCHCDGVRESYQQRVFAHEENFGSDSVHLQRRVCCSHAHWVKEAGYGQACSSSGWAEKWSAMEGVCVEGVGGAGEVGGAGVRPS